MPLTPRTRSRGRAKSPLIATLIAELLAASSTSAAPTGGSVTSGTASIDQTGSVTNINQSSNRATINWQGFSVGQGETVNFNQPSASSITLNRVIGNEQSFIQGAVNANGQVFIINSNGVLFAPGSQVNTGGLVASTLDITDADFQAGRYAFKGTGSRAAIVNQGTITASEGGYVVLLGQEVSNQGTIVATRGAAALASGNKLTLNFNGNSLVSVSVEEGVLNALVENKQAIYADGGTVILTAKAADALLSAQVNTSGIIQARSIGDLKGAVDISSAGGTAKIGGTIDASAATGDGGSIQTRGDDVRVDDAAVITTAATSGQTGTWLVESRDFTIAPSGGNIAGATLGKALASSNVTISSTSGTSPGNLYVNDAIAWSANTKLTLQAVNDIDINDSITATGAAAHLSLNYGGDYHLRTPASAAAPGGNGKAGAQPTQLSSGGARITLSGEGAGLELNGVSYTLIHSLDQLSALADTTGTTTGNFAIAQDLDAGDWSAGHAGSASVVSHLSGNLVGLGHTIDHLTLNAPSLDNVGLIGRADNSTIRDIGLVDSNVVGGFYVGPLLGQGSGTQVLGSYASGTVTAKGAAGGLIGLLGADSQVDHGSASTDVTASGNGVGGLIGSTTQVTIASSRATGNVTTTNASGVGGLIGSSTDSNVSGSYATGDVTAKGSQSAYVGGLIGRSVDLSTATSVTNSFATGNVTGGHDVGGLIGNATSTSQYHLTIANTYAEGIVTASGDNGGYAGGLVGNASYVDIVSSHAGGQLIVSGSGMADYVGGLVGYQKAGSIASSYATGDVSGNGQTQFLGGLVGYNTGSIVSSYATGDVSGGRGAIGGLVGSNTGDISSSWAKGSVTGSNNIGGLVGISSGKIADSSASGNVTAVPYTDSSGTTYEPTGAGGLVGLLQGGNGGGTGTIERSSATGAVSGTHSVGGLVGAAVGGSISDSTASGAVTGNPDESGALSGTVRYGTTISNSYWNLETTGQSHAIGAPVDDSGPANIKNSAGLTNTQFSHVSDYISGAIPPPDEGAGGQGSGSSGSQGGSMPSGSMPSGGTPSGSTPSTPSGSMPTGSTPSGSTPSGSTPSGSTPSTPSGGGQHDSGKAAALAAAAQAVQRLARAADASLQGRLEMARARADTTPSDDSAVSRGQRKTPSPVASHIVVIDPAHYSASIDRIEIDGQVFDLNDAGFAEKPTPAPLTRPKAPSQPKKK